MPQQEQISELIDDKVFADLSKLTAELVKNEQQLVDNATAALNFNNALASSKGITLLLQILKKLPKVLTK